MQVNAILTATTTANKDIKTTISHLRESQESKAELLAQTLNAFTTNIYKSTQINEINITPTEKPTPNITLGEFTGTSQDAMGSYVYQATISTNSDGILTVSSSTNPLLLTGTILKMSRASSTHTLKGIIRTSETDQYQAGELEFERTV